MTTTNERLEALERTVRRQRLAMATAVGGLVAWGFLGATQPKAPTTLECTKLIVRDAEGRPRFVVGEEEKSPFLARLYSPNGKASFRMSANDELGGGFAITNGRGVPIMVSMISVKKGGSCLMFGDGVDEKLTHNLQLGCHTTGPFLTFNDKDGQQRLVMSTLPNIGGAIATLNGRGDMSGFIGDVDAKQAIEAATRPDGP